MRKTILGLWIGLLCFWGLSFEAHAGSSNGFVDPEQWSASPWKDKVELRSVKFTDGNTGWIVGDKGIILRTTDSGATWVAQESPVEQELRGVDFADARHGWIVGGGKTWKPLSGPYHRPARPLYDIVFIDENHGWAVGSHRLIGLRGEGVDEIVLYKKGKGGVIHTSDGGKTWEVQDAGNAKDIYLLGVCFIDKKRGWVVGEKGVIYSTTDGGERWKKRKSGVKAALYAVDFVDGKKGLIAGQKGTLLATTNGGRTWKSVKLSEKEDLLDVDFVSDERAVVVGQDGVILRFGK